MIFLLFFIALAMYTLLHLKAFGLNIHGITKFFNPSEVAQLSANKNADIYNEAFLTFIIADSLIDRVIETIKDLFGRKSKEEHSGSN